MKQKHKNPFFLKFPLRLKSFFLLTSHKLIYSILAQKGQALRPYYLLDVISFEGWQYSKHRSYYEYGPEEKAFDMSRRRRLIRPRRRDLKASVKQVRGTSSIFSGKLRGKEVGERL